MRLSLVLAMMLAGLSVGGLQACGGGSNGGGDPDGGTTAPAGCPASSILCENFENGQNGWREPEEKQHATIAVDGTRPRTGKGALHVVTEDGLDENQEGNPQAIAHYRKDMPVFGMTLFTRAWVYLKRTPQEGVMGTYFILFSPKEGDWGGIELQGMNNGGFALDDWSGVPDTGWNLQDPVELRVTPGRWTCVEWGVTRHKAGGNLGHAQVWVDGAQAFDFPDVGIRPFTNFAVGWGFVHPHGDSDSEAWIDDLVVSTSRVGCD